MDYEYSCNSMEKPVLYYDALSSQARSCYMLIKLLKIDVELKSTDSIKDINFWETYTWINSFCILPTLVDDTITLCNGHSILIYLCEKYATSNLSYICPHDYIGRLQVMSMLFYEGCILYRCLGHLLTDIFLAKYPNFNINYYKVKVSNAYNSLNTFLKGHTYMIGNRLTIADLSIVSTVSALNIIFPINYERFPDLFNWFQRLKKKEFYNCNDEGILKLRYLLRKIGKFTLPSPYAIVLETPETQSEENANNSPMIINEKIDETKTLESNDLITDKNDSLEEFGDELEIDAAKEVERKLEQELDAFNYYYTETRDSLIESEHKDPIKTKMEEEDFKEIFRRLEDIDANNYAMCCCYYFPKIMHGTSKTHEKVNGNWSFQNRIDSKSLCDFQDYPLNEIKSCIYMEYYDFNKNKKDYRPSSSNNSQKPKRNKKMFYSCCCHGGREKQKKFSNIKNLLKNYKNDETDNDVNREEDFKDSDYSDTSSYDDAKHVKLKSKRAMKISDIYKDKTSNCYTNNQSEIIIKSKDDNNIEIKVSPQQKDNFKNYTNTAVGNNEDHNFYDQDFQMLQEKVLDFEKILGDLKSEMADKTLLNKSSQINRNSSLDLQVTDEFLKKIDRDLEQNKKRFSSWNKFKNIINQKERWNFNKLKRNLSKTPIVDTKDLEYSSIETSRKDIDFHIPKESQRESIGLEDHETSLSHNLIVGDNEKDLRKYSLKDKTDDIASTSHNFEPSAENNTENLTKKNSDQSNDPNFKRLQAGCNRKPAKNQLISNIRMKEGNKRIMEDNLSQSSEEVITIFYHNSSNYKIKCNCPDCYKRETIKETKSKIPRLITLKGKYHKNYSKLTREIGCDCPNRESLQNIQQFM